MVLTLISAFLLECSSHSSPGAAREDEMPGDLPAKVLFIGNSHTYYNGGVAAFIKGFLKHDDLPVAPVVVEQVLSGYTLEDHANDPNTLARLNESDWDVIVLQENTSRAAGAPEQARDGLLELCNTINYSKIHLFLFMTWAYSGESGMTTAIRRTNEEIAPLVNGVIIPVGLAFEQILHSPGNNVDLYDADGVHPSPEGIFLAAAMFY